MTFVENVSALPSVQERYNLDDPLNVVPDVPDLIREAGDEGAADIEFRTRILVGVSVTKTMASVAASISSSTLCGALSE